MRKLFEQDSQAARVSYEIAYEETNQMINKDALLEDSTLPEEEMVGGDSKSLQIGENSMLILFLPPSYYICSLQWDLLLFELF